MRINPNISRRQAITAGVAGLAGLLLPGCSRPMPPTYGSILRMGDALTYMAHRTLLPGQLLVKEYTHSDISSFPATGTVNPGDPLHQTNPEGVPVYSEAYDRHLHDGFANWQLKIEGSVAKPGGYSLADLQKFASRTQITKHTCEEGWSAIAEWTGVPLSLVLQHAGILPSARFVNFHGYDGFFESIDMLDAMHPQTILAYGMNGRNLPIQHGAPVRVRIERQVGYKSVKFIERISVTDEFVDIGNTGWAWYVGI